MKLITSPATLRRYVIGASLVTLLIAIYLLTYSGYAISGDEWSLFDATESMARRSDMRQNYRFDAYPPRDAGGVQPPPADTEPLQPILAAPLFLFAQAMPEIGLAHTVWMFNVLVTALTAGGVYAYGLVLGYRARVAAVVALVFGLGTIAWPYSRTFFREPLFTLLALLSVYLMERIRRQLVASRFPVVLGAVFAVVLAGALLSKEASLLIVPTLAVAAIPAQRITRNTLITLVLLGLVGLLLLGLVLNLDTWFNVSIARWNLTTRIQQARENLDDLSVGVRGYLFSPSRSLWVFSPVLLLGFAGWPLLIRRGHWRQIAVPLVMMVSFITGYALVRGPDSWYGGLGWGARYLVPVTPFVALWLLPVVETLIASGDTAWKRLAATLIFLVSASIQALAAVVPIDAYYDALAAQSPAIIPWNEGAWSVRWSQIVVYWQQLGERTPDLAWRYATGPAWLLPLLAVGLSVLALGSLVWWVKHRNALPANATTRYTRAAVMTTGTLAAASAIVLVGSLYAIHEDPRYYGDFAPTHDLLHQLESELQPGDVIVLNDFTYAEFFMNYYKNADVIVYTLPLSPGIQPSPEQAPEIESPNPEELIHPGNTAILAALAQQHDRLWLVINSSPFISWSVRPVEHYLARHYFAVRDIKSADYARAVLFDTTSAPPQPISAWPAHRTGAVFDASLRLDGYDIPGGTTRRPGDILPVSLLWETLAPPPQDYTVALFVVRDGQLVAQRDSFPVNHFAFTSTWRPGSLHRDNHGIALAETLPPGQYELWLTLYWWQEPSTRLPVTGESGIALGDHLVLTTITVE